jgi:hypothetical protein
MAFVPWIVHQFGKFCHRYYDGFIDTKLDSNKNSVKVRFIYQIPISASEAGKRPINEFLRPGDPDKVIIAIHKVCNTENLSKIGFVEAMNYFSKTVLAVASEVIHGACTNLLLLI